ncbi:MAG: methyltransferase domain-containing protein [Pseudomonadales bacterium]|nr:methyltransferase domain-containing protein [Pseudomonadales bacterium]MCP5186063.1 methyltransferase domain-containing protein [Pseudomonadales bacterium]
MTSINRDKLSNYIRMVGGSVAQGFNCAISAVGDRLGLYRTLAHSGPVTSGDLAEQTGLNERWLREWLRHQASVGHLDYDAATDHFSMCPEAAMVLANPESPAFLAGGFDAVLAAAPAVPQVAEAFHTGLGMSYDDHGAACACGIERLSAYSKKQALVNEVLPLVDGLAHRLREGARVADVGCGGALSTLAMARAFPASEFVGYEISSHALERARANLAEAKLGNVRLAHAGEEPLPDAPTYDFITTFDVIHDTPYPDQLISAIRGALKADGMWLCEDIRAYPTFAENLEKQPLVSLLYGFSILVCMSSGLSAPGGAGLGTLGFTEPVARRMAADAGFSRFNRLDYDNPFNAYYVIQP